MTVAGGAPGTARDGYRAAACTVPLSDHLQQLDELRAAATPGPWDVHPQHPEVYDPARGEAERLTADCLAAVDSQVNAALIVAAVNALPDLIAEARRYRALREAVEELADEFDRPVAGITFGGIPQRALFGGGDVCYRLRAALAAPLAGQHTTGEEASDVL